MQSNFDWKGMAVGACMAGVLIVLSMVMNMDAGPDLTPDSTVHFLDRSCPDCKQKERTCHYYHLPYEYSGMTAFFICDDGKRGLIAATIGEGQ